MPDRGDTIEIGDERYTLLRLLGTRGGGTVWEARRENGTICELSLGARRFSSYTEPLVSVEPKGGE